MAFSSAECCCPSDDPPPSGTGTGTVVVSGCICEDLDEEMSERWGFSPQAEDNRCTECAIPPTIINSGFNGAVFCETNTGSSACAPFNDPIFQGIGYYITFSRDADGHLVVNFQFKFGGGAVLAEYEITYGPLTGTGTVPGTGTGSLEGTYNCNQEHILPNIYKEGDNTGTGSGGSLCIWPDEITLTPL